jgi:uncharacterized RDD family membrane protein YckC
LLTAAIFAKNIKTYFMQKNVSAGTRFFGYIIDGVVSYVPALVFGLIASATGISALGLVGLLLTIAYILLRDALFGGQSVGKKAMKYKVVDEKGASLAGNYKASLVRNISLIIPIISLVDCIYVITDKPRFGDTWANTKVETI